MHVHAPQAEAQEAGNQESFNQKCRGQRNENEREEQQQESLLPHLVSGAALCILSNPKQRPRRDKWINSLTMSCRCPSIKLYVREEAYLQCVVWKLTLSYHTT